MPMKAAAQLHMQAACVCASLCVGVLHVYTTTPPPPWLPQLEYDRFPNKIGSFVERFMPVLFPVNLLQYK